jgi:hypothetical protein
MNGQDFFFAGFIAASALWLATLILIGVLR